MELVWTQNMSVNLSEEHDWKFEAMMRACGDQALRTIYHGQTDVSLFESGRCGRESNVMARVP